MTPDFYTPPSAATRNLLVRALIAAHSATTGNSAIAAALGAQGQAKAGASGALVLVAFNDDGSIAHIRASKVGENGIKPDKWYALDEAGEFKGSA